MIFKSIHPPVHHASQPSTNISQGTEVIGSLSEPTFKGWISTSTKQQTGIQTVYWDLMQSRQLLPDICPSHLQWSSENKIGRDPATAAAVLPMDATVQHDGAGNSF